MVYVYFTNLRNGSPSSSELLSIPGKYLKRSDFLTEKFVCNPTKCQSMLLGDAARGVREVGNCLRNGIVATVI
jgi:hypothetical protein